MSFNKKRGMFEVLVDFRFLLVLAIFLLMVPSVLGVSKATDTLYSGDSTTFEGYNIQIVAGAGKTTMLVKVDSDYGYIEHGLTESDYEYNMQYEEDVEYKDYPLAKVGDLKIFLKEICFNISKGSCGRINPFSNEIEPSYELYFEYFSPDVSVETSYSSDTAWLGEYITVYTKVTNDGDVDLRNLVFLEEYPSSIEIDTRNNVALTNEGIRWTRSFLKEGDSVEFNYKIKLLERTEYSLRGELEYDYEGEPYTKFTTYKTLKLLDLYDAFFNGPYAVNPNESFEMETIFENKVDDSLTFDFKIDVPAGVEIEEEDDYEIKNGDLVYSDRIKRGKTFENELRFMISEPGEYVFDLYVDSNYKVDAPSEVISRKVVVTEEELDELDLVNDFGISLNIDSTSVLEGDLINLESHIVKGSYDLTNVWFNLSCPELDFERTVSVDVILEPETYYNFGSKLLTPLLNDTDEFTFDLYIEGTVNGVRKNHSVERKITLYDLADAFTMDRDVPSSIKQGDVSLVKVSIRNNVDRPFKDVSAKDLIPSDYLYKDVLKSSTFNLRALEEKQIYSYEIKAPYYLNDSSAVITEISVEDRDFTLSSTLNTLVELKEADLRFTYDVEDDLHVGSHIPVGLSVNNAGDLFIKDIIVTFPLSERADLALINEERDSEVESLDLSETVTFIKDYIPKKSGDLVLELASISYRDEYGNIFEQEINSSEIEILPGVNKCFVLATKNLAEDVLNDTFDSNTVPFIIEFKSYCDDDLSIELDDPEIFFTLPAKESKSITFNKYVEGNFSGEAGTPYKYGTGEVKYSLTNAIEKQFEIVIPVVEEVVDNKPSTGTPNSDGSSNQPDSVDIEVPPVLEVSLIKRFAGIAGGIFVAIFLMFLILKVTRHASKKIHGKADEGEKVELLDDESNSVLVPQVADGLQKLDNYIGTARKNGVPEIEIEGSLFNKGWTKEVIDGFMQK